MQSVDDLSIVALHSVSAIVITSEGMLGVGAEAVGGR